MRPPEADLIRAAAIRRRSIRRYRDGTIPREVLSELLLLAGRAPSAWNLQPWRFVVVQTPELKAALHQAAFRQPQVEGAPAVLVLYTDLADSLSRLDEIIHPAWPREKRDRTRGAIERHFAGFSPAEREQWGRHQAGIALGYLLLIAECLGLATSPMLGFDPVEVRRLLALPEAAEIMALVALGYAAEDPATTPRLAEDAVVTWC